MRRPLITAIASAVLFLAACSSGGESPEPSQSPRADATVNVTATEFAFDVPVEFQGGVVTMAFTNAGGLPHEFAFARIDEGKTEADVEAVTESGQEPPDWMEDVAGVPGLSPGQSITVIRTLEPGTYAFLCFFPDAQGTSHASLGMHKVFTIAGDTGAALPEPDAIITATDAGLQVPAFGPGEQTLEFANGGTEPHELLLLAFVKGKGVDDVDRWFESGYQGEPPATFLGGMQTIPAGESVFLTIDLESGIEYTALDFTTESIETFTASS
jgi:hypothetical protein